MSGAVKKIIYVAKQYEKELKWAALTYAAGVVSESGKDTYHAIKDHLKKKGIPYREENLHPSQVPPGHSYWHS